MRSGIVTVLLLASAGLMMSTGCQSTRTPVIDVRRDHVVPAASTAPVGPYEVNGATPKSALPVRRLRIGQHSLTPAVWRNGDVSVLATKTPVSIRVTAPPVTTPAVEPAPLPLPDPEFVVPDDVIDLGQSDVVDDASAADIGAHKSIDVKQPAQTNAPVSAPNDYDGPFAEWHMPTDGQAGSRVCVFIATSDTRSSQSLMRSVWPLIINDGVSVQASHSAVPAHIRVVNVDYASSVPTEFADLLKSKPKLPLVIRVDAAGKVAWSGQGVAAITENVFKVLTRDKNPEPVVAAAVPVPRERYNLYGDFTPDRKLLTQHLLTASVHKGKFTAEYLNSLSYDELNSLHSADHCGQVQAQANSGRSNNVAERSSSSTVRYSTSCPGGNCPNPRLQYYTNRRR